MTAQEISQLLDEYKGLLETYREGLKEANNENERLRDALRFISNHYAEPGSALQTVVEFARLTLDEAGGDE